MAGFRARIVTIALLTASCGGTGTVAPAPDDPNGESLVGKADGFGERAPYPGKCAGEAPAVPYQPVPGPTRAQPLGPEVLHTRVGVPFPVDYADPPVLSGTLANGDCGRHYFTFELDRAAQLRFQGRSVSAAGEPTALTICFARPRFLRIDTPWYADIWQRDTAESSSFPCGTFVPVGDELQADDGHTVELPPGAYELTIDPASGSAEYELALAFEPLGEAVCGDGFRDLGEGCDDGAQEPLDWCGSDCRPQRLDIEPIAGNESTGTAQSLDGFRIVNFHAPTGEKEVDVYRLELAAGEVVELHQGERACQGTIVQAFDETGRPIAEPWDCSMMRTVHSVLASSDGTYYLRFETAAGGSRSISLSIR